MLIKGESLANRNAYFIYIASYRAKEKIKYAQLCMIQGYLRKAINPRHSCSYTVAGNSTAARSPFQTTKCAPSPRERRSEEPFPRVRLWRRDRPISRGSPSERWSVRLARPCGGRSGQNCQPSLTEKTRDPTEQDSKVRQWYKRECTQGQANAVLVTQVVEIFKVFGEIGDQLVYRIIGCACM